MLPVHDVVDLPASELEFHRASGRLCLDLVATIGERWRRRFERLRTPPDLDRWLVGAGLVGATPAAAHDLDEMRRLRGAIEALAVAALAGGDRAPEAVAIVNAAAAEPGPVPRLGDGGVEWSVPSHAAARSAVARDAIDLFASASAGRIRECAADDCALLFVDASRPGTRRWCSMGACGNRDKVARHRRRSRAAGPPGGRS